MPVSLVYDAFGFHGYYHGPVESFFRMWVPGSLFIHSVNTFGAPIRCSVHCSLRESVSLHHSAHYKHVEVDAISSAGWKRAARESLRGPWRQRGRVCGSQVVRGWLRKGPWRRWCEQTLRKQESSKHGKNWECSHSSLLQGRPVNPHQTGVLRLLRAVLLCALFGRSFSSHETEG